MKMKTLLLGVACGFLLSACGGVEEEAVTGEEQLGAVEGALCEGWDSGARRCTFKCTSDAPRWYSVTAGTVAYGNCTQYATNHCGRTPYATCWSF
ncbi:hypothetical protein [Archangium violaceum]|uniref:hypothetical protein n=1 Tax=Archangium violaceum TaxID=83451 RepID=UPI0036DE59FF